MNDDHCDGAPASCFTPEAAAALGYGHCRRLETGEVAGIAPFLFTVGLVVGITPSGYGHRYCYASEEDAIRALGSWSGHGHPPGPWVKRKGLTPELENSAFMGIPVVAEPRPEPSETRSVGAE